MMNSLRNTIISDKPKLIFIKLEWISFQVDLNSRHSVLNPILTEFSLAITKTPPICEYLRHITFLNNVSTEEANFQVFTVKCILRFPAHDIRATGA